MNPKIDRFMGKYRFLSNFYSSPIRHEGINYPTVEHAYQAAKTLHNVVRKEIAEEETPGGAKRLGNQIQLRSDWEKIKVSIMRELIRQKFTKHAGLAKKLLDTGITKLIEGNTWGDTYWGVCNGVGNNKLGKILMGLRKQLRAIRKVLKAKKKHI